MLRQSCRHLQSIVFRSHDSAPATFALHAARQTETSTSPPTRQISISTAASRSALNKLKVVELREALQQRGMSTVGLKADLVDRLHNLLLDQGTQNP
jgi:hypothetical protein